jgi:hypothetical protein
MPSGGYVPRGLVVLTPVLFDMAWHMIGLTDNGLR